MTYKETIYIVRDPIGVQHVARYEEYDDGETRLFVGGKNFWSLNEIKFLGWDIIGRMSLDGTVT